MVCRGGTRRMEDGSGIGFARARARLVDLASARFPKVEICSKVCMNETYPNISVNGVRLSSGSSGREERGRKVQKVDGRESTCERRSVVSARPNRCSQGQWNVLVYQLSATVIHLVASHAFAADISVWSAGKSYRETGKIEVPRRMSFRGLRLLFHWLHRGRKRKIEKERERKRGKKGEKKVSQPPVTCRNIALVQFHSNFVLCSLLFLSSKI